MLFKSLIAAAAVAGTVLTVSAPAKAGTDIDVYLGVGGFGPGYVDPGYVDAGYGWDDEGYGGHHGGWRISCGEGREKVRWAGFRKVRPIDCDGKNYRYKARKHGDWFVVTVRSKNGRIVDVDPIY
jgi:hypothetical protein